MQQAHGKARHGGGPRGQQAVALLRLGHGIFQPEHALALLRPFQRLLHGVLLRRMGQGDLCRRAALAAYLPRRRVIGRGADQGIGVGTRHGHGQQGGPPPRREGGAQNDDRAAQFPELGREGVQYGPGIGVVTVDFIQDDHLPAQSEGAQGPEAHVQGRHQRLIHRPHAEGSQYAPPAGAEPGLTGRGLLAHALLPEAFQPGHAVQEHGRAAAVEDAFQKGVDPRMDAVGGQLGGQREIEAAGLALRQQAVGRVQGRLGLAHAHRRFQHIDARPADRLIKGRLRRTRRKGKDVRKAQVGTDARPAKTGLVHGALHQRSPVLGRVVEKRPGGDPVRRDGQAAEQALVARRNVRPVGWLAQQAAADLMAQLLPARAAVEGAFRHVADLARVMRPYDARQPGRRAQRGKAGPADGGMSADLPVLRHVGLGEFRHPPPGAVLYLFIEFGLEGRIGLADIVQAGGEVRPRRQQARQDGLKTRGQTGGDCARNAAMILDGAPVGGAAVRQFARLGKTTLRRERGDRARRGCCGGMRSFHTSTYSRLYLFCEARRDAAALAIEFQYVVLLLTSLSQVE